MERVTRFSDAEWATELEEIMVVGVGGVGGWTAINLARIGHNLYLIDPDCVDEGNVTGGQPYRTQDIGELKVEAISRICRDFGTISPIYSVNEYYSEDVGITNIMITGLDNMKARRDVFDAWTNHLGRLAAEGDNLNECLLIDGRLSLELVEILTVQGNNEEQIAKYKEEYLFSDEEAQELPCTAKQTTFGAMTIAGLITATLCNWLTNRKLGMEFRNCPLYQRFYLPLLDYKQINIEEYAKEAI